VPIYWRRLQKKPSAAASIALTIAVKQNKLDQLEQRLLQVADPSSPEFSKHMSLAELDNLLRPNPASVDAVLSWLDAGIDSDNVQIPRRVRRTLNQQLRSIRQALAADRVGGSSRSNHHSSSNGEWISLVLPLHLVEVLLQTSYDIFEHLPSGQQVTRTVQQYSIPQSIADCIDFVGPANRFPHISRNFNRTTRTAAIEAVGVAVGSSKPASSTDRRSDRRLVGSDDDEPHPLIVDPHPTVTPEFIRKM
jgi:tripeptidyl-peptidase-1